MNDDAIHVGKNDRDSANRTQEIVENKLSRPPISSLTTVRGLAALWVVLFHYRELFERLLPTTKAVSRFVQMGDLAVPLFFILSGFVIYYNFAHTVHPFGMRSYIKYLFVRFGRIYPVHGFTLLLVLLMYIGAKRMNISIADEGYRTADFIRNVFLVQAWIPGTERSWNKPSWSISSEWFIYLLLPLVVSFVSRIRTSGQKLVCSAILASFTIVVYTVDMSYSMIVQVIPTFTTGAIIAKCVVNKDRLPTAFLRVLLAASVMLIALTPFLVHDDSLVRGILLSCFAILIMCLSILGDSCSKFWTWKPLLFLGEVSYSLYMTHMIVLMIVMPVLIPTHVENFTLILRSVYFIAVVLAIGITTLLCYYSVERPMRSISRKLARRL